jgi:hypothetical protein
MQISGFTTIRGQGVHDVMLRFDTSWTLNYPAGDMIWFVLNF